jgi:ribosomal-protein-alanine N-acetyltransferase
MDRIALRLYRPDDLAAMVALDALCFDPVFLFGRRAMRRFAEAPGAITLLAEANNDLVGFCIVHMQQRSGYIVTLDVAPHCRRHGLARSLMREIESSAQAAGADAMELHVFTENAAAIRFYEKIGYTMSGTAKDFYASGLSAWIYRKQLRVGADHNPRCI